MDDEGFLVDFTKADVKEDLTYQLFEYTEGVPLGDAISELRLEADYFIETDGAKYFLS